jgi:CheY-like chemotaxis protein
MKNILLVDDDKVFNFLHRSTIIESKIACNVAEATDGQAALNYIENSSECPDVILLDINMPGLDGFQFLKKFEERGKCCAYTSIFMLTSSVRPEDKAKALANKFVKGYFDKPLAIEHLHEIAAKLNGVGKN